MQGQEPRRGLRQISSRQCYYAGCPRSLAFGDRGSRVLKRSRSPGNRAQKESQPRRGVGTAASDFNKAGLCQISREEAPSEVDPAVGLVALNHYYPMGAPTNRLGGLKPKLARYFGGASMSASASAHLT